MLLATELWLMTTASFSEGSLSLRGALWGRILDRLGPLLGAWAQV